MLPLFPFAELLGWYQKNGRHDLPWRNYSYDEKTLGYRVWLAETMLQQTQVERVKLYFENIVKAFPRVEDLAACSYEDFFPYYKGLGYYSRARNMLKTAEKVVSDFGGIFPKSVEELRTLPGVGPYTAEAIRAFAYDMPTLSFDTNLEKIFSRYYFGNKYQKLSKEEKEELLGQIREFCKKSSFVIPAYAGISEQQAKKQNEAKRDPATNHPGEPLLLCNSPSAGGHIKKYGLSRDINNALMDYGATISLNATLSINWEKYPLPSSKFYQTRGALEPIIEKKKSSFPTKEAYVICILHEDHKKYFSCPMSFGGSEATEESSVAMSSGTGFRISPSKKVGNQKDSESSSEGQKNISFSPFLIGKNSENPRAMTQAYFLQKYGLEVSVRPPEIKSYNKFETPYMVCYAQIQSGKHPFMVFENLKVRGFEESLVEEMEFGEKEGLSLF